MVEYQALFAPLDIRNVKLRNRIVITPHGNRLAEGGLPTDRLRGYYVARARGGIALLSPQTLAVYPQVPDIGARSTILSLWNKDSPAAIRAMIEAIHAHGTKVFAQIGYAGGQYDQAALNRPAYAPSSIPWAPGGDVPRAMTREDVQRFVTYYGDAAARVTECGFDGVEIHGAHGYLVQEFMSPQSNVRTDEYGGSLENRARFAVEISRAVRQAVGDDVPVGIRLSGDEYVEGGLSQGDVLEICKLLRDTKCVDYYSISAGQYGSIERIVAPPYLPEGLHVHLATAIRSVVSPAPVTAVGRILTAQFANELISEGKCDMVGMLRAHLADPDLSRKASGELNQPTRRCIGLMDCWRREYKLGLGISCGVNPEIGREFSMRSRPTENPKRVVVVGAGPAGLELGTRLAKRGHSVVILEALGTIGGQVRTAAMAAGRELLGALCTYYEELLAMLDVQVHLNVKADCSVVQNFAPDAVMLATGSLPRVRSGTAGINAVDVETALAQPGAIGDRVAVYTESTRLKGLCVADTLARAGRNVTLITPHPQIGPGLEPNTLNVIGPRLVESNVRMTTNHDFVSWSGSVLTFRNIWKQGPATQDSFVEQQFDTLVYDFGDEPNDDLANEIDGSAPGIAVVKLGDCLSPRGIQAAMWDALREDSRFK